MQGSILGGFRMYLHPKSMSNNSPKPIKTAQKVIILHTFGVQVGIWGIFRGSGGMAPELTAPTWMWNLYGRFLGIESPLSR